MESAHNNLPSEHEITTLKYQAQQVKYQSRD